MRDFVDDHLAIRQTRVVPQAAEAVTQRKGTSKHVPAQDIRWQEAGATSKHACFE